MSPDTATYAPYDAFLLVSFGGPDGPDDVLPFLDNVLRGKNVPRERMLEVAEHYQHFGGVSPINKQNRQLLAAIAAEFQARGIKLPLYWGNRNWNPLLPETLAQMATDGKRRAIALFTSAFSSYSGCRQYRENIAAARETVGPAAPEVDKLRMFYNHPAFVEVNAEHVAEKLALVPAERRAKTVLLFTAHSIPMSMAENCRYELQLQDACKSVAAQLGHTNYKLVYQSRSGPPQQPWLEPDVCAEIRTQHATGALQDVVLLPIGFISDHMEVLYDLDTEAKDLCAELGVNFHRVATVGVHPKFVRMIADLVLERITGASERPAIGELGPSHDVCPVNCCTYTPQRPRM
jgi:protoporphyrin/coproporphyrin ferrochelatase